MSYFTDSSGNIAHASDGLLRPGELAKRNLRLLTDAEAETLLARGQQSVVVAQPTHADPVHVEPANDGDEMNAVAQQQFDEVCAQIDAIHGDAEGKDRLEEIGREYDIELDKRRSANALRSQLKAKIAETLGVAV
ncbi:MAG: hypothetical protein KBF58_10930 [Methyloversatilis sp.]|nr:hypothetical protein [Methyloversatilis sp.]